MQPAVSIPDCSTWINMKNYPFLSWIISLYNTKKKRDQLIIVAHFCFINLGFVIYNKKEENNELLTIVRNEENDSSFSLDYTYDELKIKIGYVFYNNTYAISFDIDEKESPIDFIINEWYVDKCIVKFVDLVKNIEKRIASIIKYRRRKQRQTTNENNI
ncbi:unnamed protein product [Adineta steineri]|uniref:Uncharacterized protein n=1 Tax=Adineta steineri TaxID=433720 RepID=A0A814JY55_9BILA|nr:unnamed protein product [Adineta steineri]CAF1080237.1 unnamed protein product [Adineta steineri]